MAVADGVYTAPASWDDCDWENPAGDSADCMLALRQAVEERLSALDTPVPRDSDLPALRHGERGAPLVYDAAAALADALFPLFNRRITTRSPAVYLDPAEPVRVTGEIDDDGVDWRNADYKPVSFRDLPASAQFWKDMPGGGSTADEWGAWMLKMKNAINRLHVRNCSAYGDMFSGTGYSDYLATPNMACSALRSATAAEYGSFSPAPREYLNWTPNINNLLTVSGNGGGLYRARGTTQCLFAFSSGSRYPAIRAHLKYGLWCERHGDEFSNRNWTEGFAEGVVGMLDERHQLSAPVQLGSHIQLPSINEVPDPPGTFGRGSYVTFRFYLDFAVTGGFKFQTITDEGD